VEGGLGLLASWIGHHREKDDVPLVALERTAISTRDAMAQDGLFAQRLQQHAVDKSGLFRSDKRDDVDAAPTVAITDSRKPRALDNPEHFGDDHLGFAQVAGPPAVRHVDVDQRRIDTFLSCRDPERDESFRRNEPRGSAAPYGGSRM
jgi:hypothetical protein